MVGWDAGPEGIDFCHEHGVYFIFGYPVVELTCFFVPFFYRESFYVPKHNPMAVFLFGGRF